MSRLLKTKTRWIVIVLALAALLGGAGTLLTNHSQVNSQGFQVNTCGGIAPAFEGSLIALSTNNTLINFNPSTPGVVNSVRFIGGLSTGERIVSIDFRPANGQLFGLSNTGRIYTINPASGFATVVGTAALNPALSGAEFDIDFNPSVDRIRLVSNTGQDLRVNPVTGAVAATDTNLIFAPGDTNATATPNIVGSAYTNSFAGAGTTTLYGIDATLDVLVTQGSVNGSPTSPNTGQLFTVGPLGVDTTDVTGFEIAPGGNVAYASLTTQGSSTSQLYTINLTTGAATLVGAIGGGQLVRDVTFAPRVENIYALTNTNRLLVFNSGTPGTITNAINITGLASGENVVAIDFRPGTGQLFGVTNTSRVYIINKTTGAATAVGTAAFTPALSGASFGLDFNPAVDRLRLISNTGQNLRINPLTGAIAGADTTLVFAPGDLNATATPNVVSAAYTNSFVGASTTTLYGIDATLNTLVTQGSVNGSPTSPNTGQLFTVGALGVDPSGPVGFDISSTNGIAFAVFTVDGSTTPQLYSINLTTGAATLIGPLNTTEVIIDLAVELTAPNVFAVTANNNLVSFTSGAPGTINSTRPITGLANGERIVGVDFRPATGQFFALGSTGRIYIINTTTGAALQVGGAILNPALSGTTFGFNFNPTVDRIRLVSNTGQDLRINPLTGAVWGRTRT